MYTTRVNRYVCVCLICARGDFYSSFNGINARRRSTRFLAILYTLRTHTNTHTHVHIYIIILIIIIVISTRPAAAVPVFSLVAAANG